MGACLCVHRSKQSDGGSGFHTYPSCYLREHVLVATRSDRLESRRYVIWITQSSLFVTLTLAVQYAELSMPERVGRAMSLR